jgi:DNA-binding response OmpR family regulator
MKVLIVDDDPDFRESLAIVLSSEGHKAIAVQDGREALDYLSAGNPTCVILLDLMMPRMNGWEFRARQRVDPQMSSIPVVVITADGDAETKARQLDAAGYLRKPMNLDQLVATVDRFCPREPGPAGAA